MTQLLWRCLSRTVPVPWLLSFLGTSPWRKGFEGHSLAPLTCITSFPRPGLEIPRPAGIYCPCSREDYPPLFEGVHPPTYLGFDVSWGLRRNLLLILSVFFRLFAYPLRSASHVAFPGAAPPFLWIVLRFLLNIFFGSLSFFPPPLGLDWDPDLDCRFLSGRLSIKIRCDTGF